MAGGEAPRTRRPFLDSLQYSIIITQDSRRFPCSLPAFLVGESHPIQSTWSLELMGSNRDGQGPCAAKKDRLARLPMWTACADNVRLNLSHSQNDRRAGVGVVLEARGRGPAAVAQLTPGCCFPQFAVPLPVCHPARLSHVLREVIRREHCRAEVDARPVYALLGGPAEASGRIRIGDILTAINGQSMAGRTPQEISNIIGGQENTEVDRRTTQPSTLNSQSPTLSPQPSAPNPQL